jgi:hypothetical protein
VSEPSKDVSTGRGIAAVFGALLLFALATRILEQTLGNPVVTAMLNALVALLVGYVGARIAGAQEVTVVGVAATVETCMLAYAWATGAYNGLPTWIRVLLVVTTGPAMMAGGWVRMQARLASREPSREQP